MLYALLVQVQPKNALPFRCEHVLTCKNQHNVYDIHPRAKSDVAQYKEAQTETGHRARLGVETTLEPETCGCKMLMVP